MIRSTLFLAVVGLLASAGPTERLTAADRPNILWISCEDISPQLGCYGDPLIETPHIDRLAAEGVRFSNCYAHAGVCAVARSGLITGMYPVTLGSQHMRTRIELPPHVRCFPAYLRDAGYFCTNRSKTDYNFEVPADAWDENSGRSRDWENRRPGQPFFSVINITSTHESRIRAEFDEPQHDPAQVPMRAYIPDTPVTRRDRARYYDLIADLDRQVAEILKRLEDDGLADSTIVVFWSDHGEGLPRGKRWLYDSGTHVPLIVRWPDGRDAGTVREDLVCFLDFAPTMLSLAGVPVPEHMHGRVILGEGTQPEPEYLFAHRDRMDEVYDLIRSVRDRRFRYVRNFMPQRTYAQRLAYLELMPTMIEMRRLHAAGQLSGPTALYFRETKPVEELYDCHADPDQVRNLADDPAYADVLARMRQALEDWQLETGDLGMIPEPVLNERLARETAARTELNRSQ